MTKRYVKYLQIFTISDVRFKCNPIHWTYLVSSLRKPILLAHLSSSEMHTSSSICKSAHAQTQQLFCLVWERERERVGSVFRVNCMDNNRMHNYAQQFLVHFTWNTFYAQCLRCDKSMVATFIEMQKIKEKIKSIVSRLSVYLLYTTISLCFFSNGNLLVGCDEIYVSFFTHKMSSFCSVFSAIRSESSLLRSIETFTTFNAFIISKHLWFKSLGQWALCIHEIRYISRSYHP